MGDFAFDLAHLLSGLMVVVSMVLLYQDRLTAMLNVFAAHAMLLGAAVGWQAEVQGAGHLWITAGIAFVFKGIVIPTALHAMVRRLGIHREIETVVGVGPTLIAALALTALAVLVVMPATEYANPLAREDLAFALAVVLLGLLMMITRRNAVSQIVGFMSLENGLILAAAGAKGMPLVVEVSVAFSVLIAFIVFGVFVFRIRERFDTVDIGTLERYRGEQQDGA
ncbi:hydrogenase-4 component E [Blastochloris tepida]|uniref:Hydrogenase-4 component E n=1 Tax=Blastochloris tepida TaxID=2233851 RepID=A0A348G159_9HYPH|nr:hydrogenase-4 component E [Blastochloris tepida]BBF93292.1 hydrogenase-4 component E [Blastochloris tepida]